MILISLVVGSLFAVSTPGRDSLKRGLISFAPPEGAFVLYVNDDGDVPSISFELDRDLYIGAASYSWLGHGIRHSGPVSATAYAEFLKVPVAEIFEVLGEPVRSVFKGLPALSVTRRYSMTRENGEVLTVKDTHLIIQRKWGYVVLSYSNDESKFEKGLVAFDDFVDSVQLLSEPPFGSWAIPVIIAILLVLGISGITYYRRRRAQGL